MCYSGPTPDFAPDFANKKNIDRYLKIADAFSANGAIQGDPPKAIGGGMINRKRQDYNDVGWDVHDGNYYRFLTQIDPESTSVGRWHKVPEQSVYSRFARSTDVENGKSALYFDLNDEFLDGSQSVEIKIVWLDEGKRRRLLSMIYVPITRVQKVQTSPWNAITRAI